MPKIHIVIRHFGLLVWFTVLCAALEAQAQGFALPFPASDLQQLSIAEGLSNSAVYAIHQDARGFMWFGTAEGLNRYDGYEFRVFTPQAGNPQAISGDMVTSIAEDAQGRLWLGVWQGGLNCYDPRSGRFTTYLPDPGQPANSAANSAANSVWTVAIDQDGYIWAGTQRNGLYRFDPKTKQFRAFRHNAADPSSISSDAISALLPAGHLLWIATADKGLNRLDLRSGRIQRDSRPLLSGPLNALFLDASKKLWIGTRDRGVVLLDIARDSCFQFPMASLPLELGTANVRCFLQDRKGTVWIGTDGGGIFFFDPKTATFAHLQHEPGRQDGLRSNVIFHFHQSRDGIVWIGAYKGGVHIYDEKKFKFRQADPHLRTEKLSYKAVFSIFESPEGPIWIGTDGGGLNRYDPQTRQFTYFRHQPGTPGSLSGDAVKAVYEDRFGYIWAGTYGKGLNLLAPGARQWRHFAADPPGPGALGSEHAWDIAEDPAGDLWVATLGGGMHRLERAPMRFRRFTRNNTGGRLLSDQIYALASDKNRKRLWIGTDQGLCFYDVRRERFFPAFPDSLRMAYEIKSLLLDRSGNLWFGTKRNGLHCFNPETGRLVSYRKEQGLLSNTVAALLEDAQQRLWISSNRGISCLDPATGIFSHYHTGDGLRNNEYISASAAALRDGRLLFGGPEGFELIDPGKAAPNDRLPKPVFTRLWVLNKEILPGEAGSPLQDDITAAQSIRLRHYENALSLEYSALSFTNPEKNRYACRMEGYDTSWVQLDNRRTLAYSKLPPGKYTLHLKASNDEGRWTPEPATLSITIAAPWYASGWFLSLAAAIAAALGAFMLRVRRQPPPEVPATSSSTENVPDLLLLQSSDQEFLEKARSVVEEHISDSGFSVTLFAQRMGVSRTLLHVKLKELTGQPASEFIRNQRLQRAAALLRQHRHTAAEVAYLCGFNDPKYFHKCFKDKYGVTPGNFGANTQF